MRILLTNDDGLMAPGLQALRRALGELGEVVAVAPDTGRSAAGHSITFHEPIYVQKVRFEDGAGGYALSASPADCVKFAWTEVLGERPADLVVSGINAGANVGIDVFYSGTVSAAMEGAFLGMPAVAVSQRCAPIGSAEADFEASAAVAVRVIRRCLAGGLAGGWMLNVNLPLNVAEGIRGVRVAPHWTKGYVDRFERRDTPRGRPYYWMTGTLASEAADAETDVAALAAGYVTVTPLRCDLTRHELLGQVASWDWDEMG